MRRTTSKVPQCPNLVPDPPHRFSHRMPHCNVLSIYTGTATLEIWNWKHASEWKVHSVPDYIYIYERYSFTRGDSLRGKYPIIPQLYLCLGKSLDASPWHSLLNPFRKRSCLHGHAQKVSWNFPVSHKMPLVDLEIYMCACRQVCQHQSACKDSYRVMGSTTSTVSRTPQAAGSGLFTDTFTGLCPALLFSWGIHFRPMASKVPKFSWLPFLPGQIAISLLSFVQLVSSQLLITGALNHTSSAVRVRHRLRDRLTHILTTPVTPRG